MVHENRTAAPVADVDDWATRPGPQAVPESPGLVTRVSMLEQLLDEKQGWLLVLPRQCESKPPKPLKPLAHN